MTAEDIKQLIAKDENRHLELKKTTGELKDGMHTACAFLNGEGGWLIFGIAPTSLRMLGQIVNDNTQREIAQALSGLEPAVDVSVQYIDVPDRPGYQIIAMYFGAFVWGRHPYTYHGRPYYKVESTTQVMPRDMFEERLRANKPRFYAWERQTAEDIAVKDLDEELIRGLLRLGSEKGRIHATAMAEPLEKVLDKFELLTEGRLNNAAVALFSTKVTNYSQMRLRMARFRGTDKNEFIDNQRVSGNFFELLDAGTSFFLKHLNMSGKIVGFKREESLEIPAEALREALTNALCHRQFEKYNLTPSIAIYDDRIEIENPGVFPPQLTTETIKQPHNSYPYNPIMAEVLFRTTFLENWGTGTRRIIDACNAHNVSEPVWSISGGYVCVTFKRPLLNVKNDSVESQNESSTNQVR
ncbi:MAG: ATP-binding protein, partial [Bacteroides sp.]|nr:ATP-binding protein [Bacteroides sp.]